MLLVSRDETFESKLNYDDSLSKVENIPTAIIRKVDGDSIKDFINSNPNLFSRINMLIKFEAVIFNKYLNLFIKFNFILNLI